MSSEEMVNEESGGKEMNASDVKLEGLYVFKEGMSSVYDENGRLLPVTVLRYKPWLVSQVKTVEKDGYEALQLACDPKKEKRTSSAEKARFKAAGFENGAKYCREIRQALPEGVSVGQRVSIESFVKGDRAMLTAKSRGRGFSGVLKRHGFGGGPASHGSGFHRRPGSVGNCEFPGRIMPGRKMPGHFGHENITVKNIEIVDVLPEENVLLVKGPVPGSKNTLVKLMKV